MNDYYVYGYFDPRTMVPFYIGKGKDKRMFAHLSDSSETKKTQKIEELENENLEPIIRILANDLSEEQALLIESTLIWWNQDNLTNIIKGKYSYNFRPNVKYSLLRQVNQFDFKNGIYLVNCGDGDTRKWEDFKSIGFLSAGHDPKWSTPLKRLKIGDIVIAYLKNDGYIGVGKVVQEATMATRFITQNGKSLNSINNLKSQDLFHHPNDPLLSEFCIGVDWIKSYNRGEGKFKSNSGLYTTPLIVTSLFNQKKTVEFIESEFNINLMDLII